MHGVGRGKMFLTEDYFTPRKVEFFKGNRKYAQNLILL